ncbi:hypothetical protein [Pararhizobium sp. DWP3-4]|uniref:hypothetical protein n=1 Tax=Pararhizobium sp. DWP3-4 TaxID=2804565 RepID=UPI003CF7E7F7
MKGNMTVAAVFLVLSVAVCHPAELAVWQSKALQHVKHYDGVIDARWRSTAKNALWVSMGANKYRAESFSRFVCELLEEAGAPPGTITSVSVFDPPSYGNSGWPMGTAVCH